MLSFKFHFIVSLLIHAPIFIQKDPEIKRRLILEINNTGLEGSAPHIPLILSKLTNDADQLSFALHMVVDPQWDESAQVNLQAVLRRATSESEKKEILRTLGPDGKTSFYRASPSLQVVQFFLDEVLQSEEDNIYYLTTPVVTTLDIPLKNWTEAQSATAIFEQLMNRLTPQQRIEQMVHKV